MTTVLNPKSIVVRRRRTTLFCGVPGGSKRFADISWSIRPSLFIQPPSTLSRVRFTPTQRGEVYLAGCRRRRDNGYGASQIYAKKKKKFEEKTLKTRVKKTSNK